MSVAEAITHQPSEEERRVQLIEWRDKDKILALRRYQDGSKINLWHCLILYFHKDAKYRQNLN